MPKKKINEHTLLCQIKQWMNTLRYAEEKKKMNTLYYAKEKMDEHILMPKKKWMKTSNMPK